MYLYQWAAHAYYFSNASKIKKNSYLIEEKLISSIYILSQTKWWIHAMYDN